ncbi:MAG: hypothetical protein H7A33_06865 [Deltaproteobacteria bacterium]|nr:hypothetical protein [Deltaproteobacteria bacterium]
MKQFVTFVFLLLTLFVTNTAWSKKDVSYQVGVLKDISIKTQNRTRYVQTGYHVGSVFVGTVPVTSTSSHYLVQVQVDDLLYMATYNPNVFKTYKPNEWVVNDPIQVRFRKNDMYLLRPDGREMKAKVVKKVRVKYVLIGT